MDCRQSNALSSVNGSAVIAAVMICTARIG
jgi:hypothetical protein